MENMMSGKKLIDLSIAIENGLPSDPPMMIPEIKYNKHEDSVEEMLTFFQGATKEDLPNGLGWQTETITLGTHSGTHVDAPIHYHPTMNKGETSSTIDQIPLERFMGNGVVIDISDKPDGYLINAKDLEDKLSEMNYELQEGDVVLMKTGAADKWGTKEYLVSGAGMGKEATLWLLNQGIMLVGTDAWSWDRPLGYIAEDFRKTGDSSLIWEGHFAGIEKEYYHIEKLTNLDKLPATGFFFMGFPIKIKDGSAGWIRAVAAVDR